MRKERMFLIYEIDKKFKRRIRNDRAVYITTSEVNRWLDYAADDEEVALIYKEHAIRVGMDIAMELHDVIEEVKALRRCGFCLENNGRKRKEER